ncbi:MAG: hypothetical protein RLZ04_593 [Actinomycetota bacterium]|jgi:hypothetical protein
MTRLHHTVAPLGLTAALLLGACNATTYDGSLATTTSAASTTTTVPAGTIAELLPVMLEEVRTLSEKVAANSGDAVSATYIEQLWAAISAEVQASYPDSFEDFEFIVRRCRAAADRSRPADADRAYRNLKSLADAIL